MVLEDKGVKNNWYEVLTDPRICQKSSHLKSNPDCIIDYVCRTGFVQSGFDVLVSLYMLYMLIHVGDAFPDPILPEFTFHSH